jgi:phosphoglycolate phosphatase
MIKLVAFDWNGTILDDVEGTLEANNRVLEHFGLPVITLEQYREHFRVPIRDYWIALGLDPEFFDQHSEEQEKVFLSNYEPQENKFHNRSGIKEVLEFLKDKGIEGIIFSNHIVPHIETQLERLGIKNCFTKILARPLHGRDHQLKRFKDGFLNNFVRTNNLKPDEVLVIGDTDEEVEIGKKYGYVTVALKGGHNSTSRLEAVQPDFLIDDMKDLKPIIEKL